MACSEAKLQERHDIVSEVLKITRAGNPILRETMPQLTVEEILLPETQELIADIRYTNETKKSGVGHQLRHQTFEGSSVSPDEAPARKPSPCGRDGEREISDGQR